MTHAGDIARAKAVTAAQLDTGLDVPVYLPYSAWEAAFVARWGLPPRHSRYAYLYMDQQNLNPLGLQFHQAARAYHVNEFSIDMTNPRQMDLWLRMENDYDRVTPELPPERLSYREQTKVMQNEERFNPTESQRLGRLVFDMHDRPQFRPYTRTASSNPLENPEAGS